MMKQFKYFAILLITLCVAGGFCACGDDDDDNGGGSTGGVGSGYAEMDGHKDIFKYAYYGHEDGHSEYFIFFTMDKLSISEQSDTGFTLTFSSNDNPDLKNMDLNSITEGTISKGIGLEYTPSNYTLNKNESPEPSYVSGMSSNRETTTVTITKTGTNRYRIVAKEQVYLVQENDHGVWYSGDKPGVRTVVGNFEWEGPIVDAKSVIPAEYWQE